MIQEFREFIAKGNVIMPIGAIPLGEPNFGELTVTINDSVIAWGAFVTTVVMFLITALAVFSFVVKPYNVFAERLGNDEEIEEQPDRGPSEIELLISIRDTLRERLQ